MIDSGEFSGFSNLNESLLLIRQVGKGRRANTYLEFSPPSPQKIRILPKEDLQNWEGNAYCPASSTAAMYFSLPNGFSCINLQEKTPETKEKQLCSIASPVASITNSKSFLMQDHKGECKNSCPAVRGRKKCWR